MREKERDRGKIVGRRGVTEMDGGGRGAQRVTEQKIRVGTNKSVESIVEFEIGLMVLNSDRKSNG